MQKFLSSLIFFMVVPLTLLGAYPLSSISTSTDSTVIIKTIHLLNEFANLTKSKSSRSCLLERDCTQLISKVLELEIFTVATGNHLVFPPNPAKKIEKKIRQISRFVKTSWLKLCAVEKVEEIINGSINAVISRMWSPLARKVMSKPLMNFILPAVMDDICEKFPDCLDQTKSSPDLPATQMKWYFPLNELRLGIVDKNELADWLQNREIRKFLIHREFYNVWVQLNDEGYTEGVTVNSPLKVSCRLCCLDEDMQRLQRMYSKVLDDISTNFSMTDFPRSVIPTVIYALTEVVEVDNKLEEKSEEDEYLNFELRIIFVFVNLILVGLLFYFCYSSLFFLFIRPILNSFETMLRMARRIFCR